MWWKRKPEPPLRDELVTARDRVQRQIEIMTGPHSGGYEGGAWGETRSVIADLQSELRQLNEAIANIDKDDTTS